MLNVVFNTSLCIQCVKENSMTKLEQQIRDRLFTGKGDDYDIGSSAEWLMEVWIEPIEKFGL